MVCLDHIRLKITQSIIKEIDYFGLEKKSVYYRKVALDKRSAVEQEEDTYWWEAYDDFLNFLKEQTNSSAIRSSVAEADDVIALWIEAHKDSKNVIVSTDSDFYQLAHSLGTRLKPSIS